MSPGSQNKSRQNHVSPGHVSQSQVNTGHVSRDHISLNRRRWQNFRRNRRAFISLIVFSVCFTVSLFAEILANDRPILVKYRDGFYMPVFQLVA